MREIVDAGLLLRVLVLLSSPHGFEAVLQEATLSLRLFRDCLILAYHGGIHAIATLLYGKKLVLNLVEVLLELLVGRLGVVKGLHEVLVLRG